MALAAFLFVCSSAHSEEFKRGAVRIALTCGLTRRQASSDPLPGRWCLHHREGGHRHVDPEQVDQDLSRYG